MQVSMSNTNFQGKQEVLYGLRQAAKEAKNSELFNSYLCGPRPINKISETGQSQAAMKAYLDMSVYDKSFENTIAKLSKPEAEEIKETLKPQKLQWTEINPFEVFKKNVLACINEHKKDINKTNIENFFKKLSSID